MAWEGGALLRLRNDMAQLPLPRRLRHGAFYHALRLNDIGNLPGCFSADNEDRCSHHLTFKRRY